MQVVFCYIWCMKETIVKKLISRYGNAFIILGTYLLICFAIVYNVIDYTDYYKDHIWYRAIFCFSLNGSLLPAMLFADKIDEKLSHYAYINNIRV